MRLEGREGNCLELSLVGYQFPDEAVDPWDSNWLLVSVRVVMRAGTWEVVDPCLTTWEAKHLVRWLVTAATRDPAVAQVSLTEPNLSVSATSVPGADDRAVIEACFDLELRPPWPGPPDGGGGSLCIELEVERSDLARAAASLLADLVRYPQRGSDPTA